MYIWDDILVSDEDIEEYLSEDEILHYGMPRRSGRYPWGSGDAPYQHSEDFLSRVEELQKKGWKETPQNIKDEFGLSTGEYRAAKSVAGAERRAVMVAKCEALKKKGLGASAIGRELGINESTVRGYLDPVAKARKSAAMSTADFLREQVDQKGIIEIGKGSEKEVSAAQGINISTERMKQAVYILEGEGYKVIGGRVNQVTNPGKKTTVTVLAKPDTEESVIYQHPEQINYITDYTSPDDGETFIPKFQRPASMDSNRIQVAYAEDGGASKEGVIELRRGVKDLDLRGSNYAQVRILVDNSMYMKGMAVYADDLPDGIDVRFNTNKKRGTPLMPEGDKPGVFKKIKSDPDDPFGALLREEGGQYMYTDENGERKLGLINKTRQEGDWSRWSDKIPAQFLSKQTKKVAKEQLDLTYADREAEFEEINSLTNPTLRKNLLQDFADGCDSSAVDLKAVSFPRQKYKVILPINDISENEVYAPSYEDGEKVALIRYPHAGRFEIPILTVNNKNAEGKRVLGDTPDDAVGINIKTAGILSGADFDGDTVTIIPLRSADIRNKAPLKGLKDFDPKLEYAKPEGVEVKLMKKSMLQREMGEISNLITDMTLKGASDEELERAVKHSMVVVDAVKHKLDYTRSFEENGIASLKKKYQGTYDENGHYSEGASTLISRSKGDKVINERTEGVLVKDPETGKTRRLYSDPETGEKLYTETGRKYQKLSNKYQKMYDAATTAEEKKAIWKEAREKGEFTENIATQKSTKMAEAKDANELVSNYKTSMELLYADYANNMKALANRARKEASAIKETAYNPEARKQYQEEVDSLNAKLELSEANRPRERRAQIEANAEIKAKTDRYDLDKAEIKKLSQKALAKARIRNGAARVEIEITQKEWDAIQSGAVSPTKLDKILLYADSGKVKQLAMPKSTLQLSTAKQNKIMAMKASGKYTTYQIAQAVGVSSSTVSKYLNLDAVGEEDDDE